jgi:hypothetical protein
MVSENRFWTGRGGDGVTFLLPRPSLVLNLQVQLVDENNSISTVLQLYVTLTISKRAGNDIFLLHEYTKNAVMIQVAYDTITLNNALYANIRQNIIDKLGLHWIESLVTYAFRWWIEVVMKWQSGSQTKIHWLSFLFINKKRQKKKAERKREIKWNK